MERAFFVEHHRRYRGDRLGHRIDSEQRIVIHGPIIVEPIATCRLEVHDLPVSGDEGDRADEPALVNLAIDKLGESGESVTRKAGSAGIDVC
jgi:hypothetical protein